MYFNRKNTEQKNWRMIKKGKHFLFGCSLVLAIGAVMAAPSVKADEADAKDANGVSTSASENESATITSGTNPSTYSAPAETTATPVVTTSNSSASVESSSTTQKEADSVQAPSLTAVADTSALTAEEISNVTEAIKGSNPTAVSVQVSNDGSAVVTFADGSSATLSASQTIKDGSQVSRVRTTRALRSTVTRATEGSENLDYTNKEDVEGYVKISYEVDKANNVIHWTVLDNPGRKGNSASGYVYFTIPKDSVGAPTNWSVVQKDKNGKITDTRNYWKDNDGSYLMGQKGRMDTYTGTEMTKRLTELFKKTKNPAIKGNEAAVAAQTAERSQALYTLTADNNKIRNVMWTITFDTPILDKTKPLDFVAGMQGTGLIGGPTNIMTGFTDNFIEEIKFQAVAVKEKYTAKVGGSFDADPAKYVTNKAGTPEFPNNYRGATTFAWKDGQAPTATTPGTYTKTVVVTYPAHYKQAPQEVTVTFEVQDPRTDAEKNEPTAKAQTVTPGSTPNAQDSIGNVSDLPSGTTFAYKTPVDTTTEGEKDATVVVTYPDNSTEEVPVKVTVKDPSAPATDADKNTPVVKDQTVKPGDKPSAKDSIGNVDDLPKGTTVEFKTPVDTTTPGEKDATVVVTYPDGSKDEVPVKVTVKDPSAPATDADKNKVTDPALTPVVDPSNLTDAEKGKVAEEVKKSNPSVTDVKVGKDGTTTVTYPDGTTAVIPADKTVKKSTDKVVTNPKVTPVVDPSNLTDAEKAKVAEEVKKSNPTAKDIKVNKDGSVVVTFEDGTTAVIPADKTVKKSSDKVKESDGVKNPSVTPVTDPSNLTDAEKAKVADEVKKANPTATDIKVNKDGSVVVTFADGSVAVIASENAVKEATKESAANPSTKKVGAKELPNTGTEQSNASLGLALLAAATGGLLFAKKRKEEE